jgi:hypothetical protein
MYAWLVYVVVFRHPQRPKTILYEAQLVSGVQ